MTRKPDTVKDALMLSARAQMLAHQFATLHRLGMLAAGKASDLLERHGPLNQVTTVEAARQMNVSVVSTVTTSAAEFITHYAHGRARHGVIVLAVTR